ncbi:MAG: hypothetical protein SNJ29_10050 [Rikenellaceae bacterium]
MKQRKITEQDYLKANRKASREEEIATYGKQITHRTKIQKSKKSYDRTGHKAALRKLPFFLDIIFPASANMQYYHYLWEQNYNKNENKLPHPHRAMHARHWLR